MRIALSARRAVAACAGALAASAIASVAWAQPAAVTGEDFVTAAVGSDNFEIMSGRLALIASSSPSVRAFAAEMIRDHTAAKAALAATAARSSLPPPSDALGSEEAALLASLQGVGRQGFDALYIRDQRMAHLTALQTEAAYARDGTDEGLKRIAGSDLPMIQRHLQQIDGLSRALLQ